MHPTAAPPIPCIGFDTGIPSSLLEATLSKFGSPIPGRYFSRPHT